MKSTLGVMASTTQIAHKAGMDAWRISRLTEQQRAVLRLVYKHLPSREIAPLLGIEPGSVDQHIKAAMRTLGVGDRRTAARLLAEYEATYFGEAPQGAAGDPPPDRFRSEAALRATQIRQAPLGAIFEPQPDYLAIDSSGDATDQDATSRDVVRQLHAEALRKVRRFASVAVRLDNQLGWQGIAGLCDRLVELLDRPIDSITDHLGSLYSATLELGSFLEMDQAIQASNTTYASPLDAEVRRPLQDAVGGLAPWLRMFPTVRQLDDDAGQFLMPPLRLESVAEAIDTAGQVELIKAEDAEILSGLVEAAKRGEFLGSKAERRSYLSARNLVVAVAGVLSTLILDGYASQSPLIGKAGAFIAGAEKAISQIVADLPVDIRSVIEVIVADGHGSTVLPPVPQPTRKPPASIWRSPRGEDEDDEIGGTLFYYDGSWYVNYAGSDGVLAPVIYSNSPLEGLERSVPYTVLGKLHSTDGRIEGFAIRELVFSAKPEPVKSRKTPLF